MAGSPDFKVYSPEPGAQYRAAFKNVDEAAAFVAAMGEGWSIRYGHARRATVWLEGHETQSAQESYDFVTEVTFRRMESGIYHHKERNHD